MPLPATRGPDPLFPHGPMTDLFPRASLPIDMGKYGRPVKYARGLLSQGDFRPIPQPARRTVVQAPPPPPRGPSCCPVCCLAKCVCPPPL